MRFLLVGGGAREHAIAYALMRKEGIEIYSVMKNRNPGIMGISKDTLFCSETENVRIREWALEKGVHIAVIGPEAPLGLGLVDELLAHGIGCVGPTAAAAKIEVDKEFSRNLMKKHSVPGQVIFEVFDSVSEMESWVMGTDLELVVKPVGLTGGKGVKIMGEHMHSKEDVIAYAREIIEKNIGGIPRVVMEERLVGEEFTLQCFCDGNIVVPMPAVQDHKRAYEGDKGPNTGGMGSYSQADHLLPFMVQEDYDKGVHICQSTIDALREEGSPYKGILYGQFMLTANGPKVIEFNARFGDPEAMNVLPLLETAFADICNGIANGTLDPKASFSKRATVCKYIVPQGYGVKSQVGEEILIGEQAIKDAGAMLFYAAVDERDGRVYTGSSRSLGIVGFGDTIAAAESVAEAGLTHVKGNVFMRHDIGKQEAITRKIQHMEEVLGRPIGN